MNRIDRLFAILLQLQRRARLRGADLAAHFGISQRTIYRDMAALMEMGVPIISLPGEGYELEPGYFLPPLLFTPPEAQALFLGAQMLRQQAEGSLTEAMNAAQQKLYHVLPPATRQQVDQMTAIIQFFAQNRPFDLDDRQLLTLITAIQERRVIWLRYFSYNREEWTEREVEPLRLTYAQESWYLAGYCWLRQEERSFRLGRIAELRLLAQQFEPRKAPPPPGTPVEVQIRFSSRISRWVNERQHYGYVAETIQPDSGDLICTYRLDELREIVPWLLSWGDGAEPLAPPELRAEIASQLRRALEKLT